jgi:hypothetical protein
MNGHRAVQASPSEGLLDPLLARVESATSIDPLIRWLERRTDRVLPDGRVRDVLHGELIGHPAHPALILLPAGAFLSAGVLDLVPGQRAAVRALVITGVVSSVPAALAGVTDWRTLRVHQQRVGIAHAGANLVGLAAYVGSLAADARGHQGRARALRMIGLGAISGAGYVGGHLSYRLGAGVNARSARTADLTRRRNNHGSVSELRRRSAGAATRPRAVR